MLPTRYWKRSLQQSKCTGIAHGSNLPTANKYLFADILLFERGEGEEATSPFIATENKSIDAFSPSLEAPITTILRAEGDANGSSSTMANKCLFGDLLLFESREGDEATTPLFLKLKTSRLMLPARRWKRPLQLITCGGGCKLGRFHNGKQMLVCRSFILYSPRGRRSNVSLFYS